MKVTILLWSVALSVTVQATSMFTDNQENLNDQKAPQRFFDPHNHTGGILPPLAMIAPDKFITGERLTFDEIKDFWFKVANFYSPASLKNARMSNGTKLLLTCNEPSQVCNADADALGSTSAINDARCRASVLNNIYNVLSATPLTAFNTAYSIRGGLWQIPDLTKTSSGLNITQAKILEMARTGAALVELSESFIGGGKGEDTKTFSNYKNILDDLRSEKTSPKNADLKRAIESRGLPIPDIKWLLLTHTLELGKVSDDTTLSFEQGQCIGMDMPGNLNTDPISDLYSVLASNPDVVGVDVAGPEYTCFANAGMKDFKELASTTYLASKARRQNSVNPSKMIVRVHVGEGAPIVATEYTDDKQVACEEIKKFPQIRTDPQTGAYVHQEEARRNISFLLRAIGQLKEQNPDMDDYIIFRLGHLTHITKEQAELAKTLGVTADANLSSNISTQSLPVNRALLDQYLVENGVTANNVRDLLATLERYGAPLGRVFEGHGLKWLLYNGVLTTLGTDGSGVEHSSSLAREYRIAEKLIEYWNLTDPDFKARNVSINDLLRNQQMHFDNMGYGK